MPEPVQVSAEQITWFRLYRSGLVEPFRSATEAAARLVGVQAQIVPAAGLALWNRLSGLTFADLETSLYSDRTLIKLWGQRHTLHLYPAKDWPWVFAMLSPDPTWTERQLGNDPAEIAAYADALTRVESLLLANEAISRRELQGLELTPDMLNPWGGIFSVLVRRGLAVHARAAGGQARYAHRQRWLPGLDWDPPSYEEANIEFLRRFLAVYGPATRQDFCYWRAVKAVDAERWLSALRPELVEVCSDGVKRFLLARDLEDLANPPPPFDSWPIRLLGRFEPLLLSTKDKRWLVPPEHIGEVQRPAGHIEAGILARGKIAGTWRYDRTNTGLVISLRPFQPLSRDIQAAVQQAAAGVAAFFGLPLQDIRN